jgi:heptosyltransferase III
MHIGIFRTDRIGDLVLTLPMAEAVKRARTDARVTFIVQDAVASIARLCPFIDEVVSIPGRDLDEAAGRFAERLRALRLDAAVFAYPRPRLALAAYRARIPARSGTAYRVYSPLFTHRVREHRKHAHRHERDYNLALLDALGIDSAPAPLPSLAFSAEQRAAARALLAASGVADGERFAVLHPGSGGSARDWSPERFGELARALHLSRPDLRILATGTTAEAALTERVRAAAPGAVTLLARQAPLDVFAALLSQADVCVANSTGPLHLAAAGGIPVLGLYPFHRPCNARRWGPLGARTAVLAPGKVDGCPACAREHCPEHDRMDRIAAADAARAVFALLPGTERPPAS